MSATATAPAVPSANHGTCSPPKLAELIRDLYLEETSGTLVLSHSGVEKRIYLDRGMILRVSSSLDDEGLPPYLVQRGLLSAEEALALKGLDDRQAAEALLGRGRLNLEALGQATHGLAAQVLTAVFRWEDMEYRFEEGPAPPWPIPGNVVVSFELIIRALRTMVGFDSVRDALLCQERVIRLSEEHYLPFDQLGLSPIEGYLISRIDGQTKASEILSLVPPSEEDLAARLLFGLLILGLAKFQPPINIGMLSFCDLVRGYEEKRRRQKLESQEIMEFYERACRCAPAELLGATGGSSREQIELLYQELKERFEASRFLKNVQAEHKEELQIIEASLLEAFLALRSEILVESQKQPVEASERALDLENMSKRKELSKSEQQSAEDEHQRLSDQFFARAREYWKLGDYFNCIRYCEFAISHRDNDAAISSLLGQALVRNPEYRWQKRAEAAFRRAIELEPFNPEHRVQMGEFYCAHGLTAKARSQFLKALEIVPSHKQARQGLKALPAHKG